MIRNINSLTMLAAAAAVAATAFGPGVAQAYPDKPVTMIVNAGAGGSTSGGARILAKAMKRPSASPSWWSPSRAARAPRARCWC